MNRPMPAAADNLRWGPGPGSQRIFLGVSAVLFVASATATVLWCLSMSDMGEIPMPGGWMMSMMWMPMCEQTWLDAAASFLGMWIVMMVAMMLPALMPMLWRYRQAIAGAGGTRTGWLTLLVGIGYFTVWAVIGLAVFPAGAVIAAAGTQMPQLASVVPVAAGAVVLVAGVLQFSGWKARHLTCCRAAPAGSRAMSADARTAWQHGLRLGLHCSCSCAGLTAILLVLGMMDLRAMIVVMAAITAERLAPVGAGAVRAVGVIAVCSGLFLILRAI